MSRHVFGVHMLLDFEKQQAGLGDMGGYSGMNKINMHVYFHVS